MEMLDCIGIPEFFTTHIGAIEDAGGGMMRVIRCIERNGVLIPVVSCVTPALSLLRSGVMLSEAAQKIACREIGAAH